MAAVFAPLDEIERGRSTRVDGYVVVANINSTTQAVIGGATAGGGSGDGAASPTRAHQVDPLPVSHAFHTEIVAPASRAARAACSRASTSRRRTSRSSPTSTGEFYPMGPGGHARDDRDPRHARSPRRCSSSRGCETLYDAGARVFVEVGPKQALQGFVDDVLGDEPDVVAARSPTTRRWATSRRSTRRCAACTPRASASARRRERRHAATSPSRRGTGRHDRRTRHRVGCASPPLRRTRGR